MVEMDSRLKGIIINHTLKSHKLAPIESANVLRVTMMFYWGFKYKSPSKRRRDKLRKEKFLATFRRDPILVPIPFLEPDQSPSPAVGPGWTSSWKHGHCLCYRDGGGGDWNQETASEVYLLGPGGKGCWKGKGTDVCLIGCMTLWTRGMR